MTLIIIIAFINCDNKIILVQTTFTNLIAFPNRIKQEKSNYIHKKVFFILLLLLLLLLLSIFYDYNYR